MKGYRWVLAAGVAAALLAACGQKGGEQSAEAGPQDSRKLEEVVVSLDGYKGPENVGLLMAAANGYFEDAGLEVGLYPPLYPSRPVRYVVDGTDDIAIAQEPQVALAKEKGAPIIAVGSVVPRPTAAMIWLRRSHIDGIAGLRGRTIAIPGPPFQKAFLKAVLAHAGLTLADVKVKTVRYHLVSALVKGRADAIFGGSWNLEGVTLEVRGLEPVVRRIQSLGAPPYDELVVVARNDFATQHSQTMRRFLGAVVRGTRAAVADPKAAADAIVEAVEGNPGLSRKITKAELRATLPLLSDGGFLSPDRAGGLLRWMHAEGLIKRRLTARGLLSNRFLPHPERVG
jgi:putative hydroxymethylpyrimidine transport system substrate-binding protein